MLPSSFAKGCSIRANLLQDPCDDSGHACTNGQLKASSFSILLAGGFARSSSREVRIRVPTFFCSLFWWGNPPPKKGKWALLRGLVGLQGAAIISTSHYALADADCRLWAVRVHHLTRVAQRPSKRGARVLHLSPHASRSCHNHSSFGSYRGRDALWESRPMEDRGSVLAIL